MAIKRVTVELDDSPDQAALTRIPEAARGALSKDFKTREMTTIPTEETAETQSLDIGGAARKAPGRTMSDLVAEFVNQPRAMATLLMFAPFAVYLPTKIPSFGHLIYPLTVGILLNIVWFGTGWITSHMQKRDDG